jgi:hypothetical protein
MDSSFCDNYCDLLERVYGIIKKPENQKTFSIFLYQMEIPDVKKMYYTIVRNNKDNFRNFILMTNRLILELRTYDNLKGLNISKIITKYLNLVAKTGKEDIFEDEFLDGLLAIANDPNFVPSLELLFYLLSDSKRCNLIINRRIDRNELIKAVDGNLDILKHFILPDNVNNPWQKEQKEAYKTFQLLNMLDRDNKVNNKGQSDILQDLGIVKEPVEYTEKHDPEDIVLDYNMKFGHSNLNDMKNDNLGMIMLNMRRNNHSLYEIVDFLFPHYVKKFKLRSPEKLVNTNIVGNHHKEYQRNNNIYGIKIFVLNNGNIISNGNCFNSFR